MLEFRSNAAKPCRLAAAGIGDLLGGLFMDNLKGIVCAFIWFDDLQTIIRARARLKNSHGIASALIWHGGFQPIICVWARFRKLKGIVRAVKKVGAERWCVCMKCK
jgi:hypothetical protein